MEVNAQLLGGAAVTVFLALIFFGVVVLWDVALALRSVGDKIDKLEDNIDDDLTDIGHSLDNISNGRVGGGGGTQLHLSGGTISSGPSPGQGQGQPTRAAQDPGTQAASGGPQPSEPRQTTQQPRGGSGDAGGVEAATDSDAGIGPRRADTVAGETRATDTGGVDEGMAAARAADRASVAGGAEPAAGGTGVAEADEPSADLGPEPTAPDAEPTGTTPDDGPATAPAETASDSDTARPPDAGDTADEPDVDAATETETGTGAATDGTASDRPHPRAARNQGRFVASPDRTAWYAVRLDRDAIADSRPTIAGELTDGSETDGDDAAVVAGPIESTATDETAASTGDADATETDDSSETTDDSVVAAPPAETADGEPIDRESTAPADGDASIDGDPETVPVESDVGIDGTDDGETDADSDEDETVAGGEGPVTDERNSVPDDSEGRDEVDDEDEHETDGEAIEFEPVEADAETAEADPDEGTDRSNEPDRESDALDAVSDDEQAVDAADPLAGDVTAFEFDDEDLEDVTVEEAVETINEDAPAPELSSHQFDVSAEVYGSDEDGDGADPAGVARDDGGENTVLTYEFDTDTVEISGSTKRLLQYQLRSFADRDATPEADVTIGRDRIVIEIPDSDGDAVQRWSEAAVDIIDRTLYLSDNSSDDS